MDDHPATLEKEMQPTQPGDPSPFRQPPRHAASRVRGNRFTYPSGSRPLDGYTIKRGIGIGGFGEVYFALSDAGKEVALKRIQRNLDVELRGVRQCLNLKHVNLISLWDIRTNDHGESWVVMEYVPGDSLRDVIERHPQGMPRDLTREWFDAIAAGVTYLHDRGIVHRDLKPGNIFRDDDEQVIKIGDYGLSKFISCSNRDGQTESVGTFHYMAPEIGKGVYGKEIDVYAMGIILFEMLTGRVPFEGESSQEIIMKHLTADPDLGGLEEPWRHVIRKSLAKDPERRFPDVPAMLKDLDQPAAEPASEAVAGPAVAAHAGVPPIQPMFIGDDFASDEEIRFGELRESAIPLAASHAGSLPRAKPLPVGSPKLPDEPIARAVSGGWQQATRWWNNANLTTPVKVVILAGAGVLLLVNSPWLIPVSVGLGLLYLLYYTVRSLLQPGDRERPRKISRAEKARRLRQGLSGRPASDLLTESIGSLVVAAIVCAVLGCFTLLATTGDQGPATQQWAFYAWSVIVSVVATWSLLIVGKSWEHRQGDAVVRRFVMLCVGVVVGLFAFFAAGYLHLGWDLQAWVGEPELSPFPADTFLEDGAPKLLGSVLFFSGLFLVLRWWRQADPVRRTRLSIWSVGLCLVWGMLIGQFFHFPLPWSCVLAVMISIATQVSSPWLTPEQRHHLIASPR
jgi:arginine exporter protein ArgO